MNFMAWGDESGSHAVRDPDVYLMAAAISEAKYIDQLRGPMEALRLPSSGPKLHWRAESSQRRAQIVDVIASLPLDGFVVVRRGSKFDRSERQRKKCLEHLMVSLAELGCGEIVLESRGRADDQRDADVVDHLRRRRMLSSDIHLSHQRGPAEPALWIADALCGAVSQDRLGEPRYLKTIASRVTVEVLEA
ncbi:hypothetical protein [Amycolatopsis sp. cmx-4-68]|uniref:hypothetical protein n=1 Tax=Amycolatopsis sp. cmx-4-68 TaxID=2790938 RepID=UPI0039794C08